MVRATFGKGYVDVDTIARVVREDPHEHLVAVFEDVEVGRAKREAPAPAGHAEPVVNGLKQSSELA